MTERKSTLFISEDKEKALIQQLVYKIKMANLDIHPFDTCFLMVSPDYSGIVTQHLSHALSVDREIFHIEAVNVPFSDEPIEDYVSDFRDNYARWSKQWKHFVLIEAGIIRGNNYTWITQLMDNNYHTVALCENYHSKFQSDFVGMYYYDETHDLHFWWEQPNNHWRCYD
jgi:hypothetical protein